MKTRESELERVLLELMEALPEPEWIAVVDADGLPMASVPERSPVGVDRIAAMAGAANQTGERLAKELEAGELRFVTVVGAKRQVIVVRLRPDRYLSIGLSPQVPAQTTFGALSQRVSEILHILEERIATST